MSAPRKSTIGQVRQAAASLSPLDYTRHRCPCRHLRHRHEPRSLDFYRSAATVIPTLLVAVAIQGRVLELSSKLTFPRRYRTVMLAVVVFGGKTGALMTIARDKTNWAAHLYV
jgi:hypothetical protein